ncbi:uncharacterized protein LOC131657631 [Vicia villosa]|uniref:uncharacterized protein LOC131657631 n=1 Tax=Vicia villosa TaxID=3911 RepID=UPI00273CA453|nr:uncharacterized protein LOC131657631 [Vicia villosa]
MSGQLHSESSEPCSRESFEIIQDFCEGCKHTHDTPPEQQNQAVPLKSGSNFRRRLKSTIWDFLRLSTSATLLSLIHISFGGYYRIFDPSTAWWAAAVIPVEVSPSQLLMLLQIVSIHPLIFSIEVTLTLDGSSFNTNNHREILKAIEVVERDSFAIAQSFTSVFEALRLSLSQSTDTSYHHIQCFTDAAGHLEESVLDAATKGNRYINSCLKLSIDVIYKSQIGYQPKYLIRRHYRGSDVFIGFIEMCDFPVVDQLCCVSGGEFGGVGFDMVEALRLSLSQSTDTSLHHIQCFTDAVGHLQESVLDATTKGNRYINLGLNEREYQRGDKIAWYADGDKIVRYIMFEVLMWSLHIIANCKIAKEERRAAVGFRLKKREKWPSQANLNMNEPAIHGLLPGEFADDFDNWKSAVQNYWSLL